VSTNKGRTSGGGAKRQRPTRARRPRSDEVSTASQKQPEESPELKAALEATAAISRCSRVTLEAQWRLRQIAEHMRALGIMDAVSCELVLIGDEVHRAAKEAQEASSRSVSESIHGHQRFFGELMLGLVSGIASGEIKQ
jgi:hypothetical protein